MYYQPVEPAEKALEREEYIKSRIRLLVHKILLHWSSENQKSLYRKTDCNRQKACQTLYGGNEYLSGLSEIQSFKARKEQFKISVSAEKSKLTDQIRYGQLTSPISKWGRSHMYRQRLLIGTAVLSWAGELSDTLDTALVFSSSHKCHGTNTAILKLSI